MSWRGPDGKLIPDSQVTPQEESIYLEAGFTYVNDTGKQPSVPTEVKGDPLYQKYVQAFNQAGVAPTLDQNAFSSLSKTWQDTEGGLAGLYQTQLYPAVAQKYNTAVQDYYKAQGQVADPSLLMSTSYDTSKQGDWRGNGSDWMLAQVNDIASKANNYVSSTADIANKTEEDKSSAYKFEMPTEWQTIEDLANETLKAGQPTLTPESVTQWDETLEGIYSPIRDKLKANMADYWASLFPQGGGSGRQAVRNEESLVGLEQDKLQREIEFAQGNLANKLAEYQNAQNILQGIGQFKGQSDQFKSSQDAQTAWNNAQLQWTMAKSALDTTNAQNAWNRQADLATTLANLAKPQQADLGTTLANALAGGVGMAGGNAGLTALLKLLPNG
jgi:hypothetical protein